MAMQEPVQHLSTASVDQLGERLRRQVTADDLRLLDQYRREFDSDYAAVVDVVRTRIGLDVSGRPAKSTTAIVDKLKRGSMRLSQMQDIAGCRVIVTDTLAQNAFVQQLGNLLPSTVLDRRDKPSHGYRAVHVIVRLNKRSIEVQVRTEIQHLWAECSEKMADKFGIEVKYGGGDSKVRYALDESSRLISVCEESELSRTEQVENLAVIRRGIEGSNLGPEKTAELVATFEDLELGLTEHAENLAYTRKRLEECLLGLITAMKELP